MHSQISHDVLEEREVASLGVRNQRFHYAVRNYLVLHEQFYSEIIGGPGCSDIFKYIIAEGDRG